MLKGIPDILSPELLKILMEMGHGDTLCIGDGNFPAASMARRLVRCDGHGVAELLDAIMQLFPLDSFVQYQVGLMEPVPGDKTVPVVWDTYKEILAKYEDTHRNIELIERFAFYERAKEAYVIVATSETALYANIILKKGVIVK